METGVFTGGTSILMAKALERHDPAWAPGAGGDSSDGSSGDGGDSGAGGGNGGRRLWSADSFQGTPAPVAQDEEGGDGKMRTG